MYQKITYITQIEDVPTIRPADLVSISEAADLLGVSIQTVDYHIRAGRLAAIIAKDEYEKTSYERRRRWLLRSEVEALMIDIVDNVLRGQEWQVAKNGEVFAMLPEVAEGRATKGNGGKIVRRITLNQDDTGDLEIDIQAIQHAGTSKVKVDIQSEKRYPDMSGIRVELYTPTARQATTTNHQGAAVFNDVPTKDLPLARIRISPSDPQSE